MNPISDLDLAVALAEVAAVEVIGSYGREDWRDSPVTEMPLDVVHRGGEVGRSVPNSKREALDKFELEGVVERGTEKR